MDTTTTSPETEFVSILGASEKSEAPPRISSRSLPDSLPILGLSDIVIFPGAIVPLLVETGPSLKLIDDIVAGDRLFGAVLQRKPEIAEPQPADLHEVGCVSRLSKMVKFPDGTVRVLVEGLWRIRLKNFMLPAPYLRANYELLRDETENSVELQAMLRNAHKQFEEIAKMSTALTDQVKIAALNTEHPGHFADLIAANLNLPLEERQKLLETISVRERLQKLLPMLNREQEVLTLSSKIQSDVASSIAKTQRDFFLREQLRAIQRELGDSEPSAGEAKSLREKIDAAVLPAEVRKAAEQELERLAANAARRRRIRHRAELSRLDSRAAVGKIHRGQTGFEGGGKNFERAAFRPDQSQRPPARISRRHQTPQGNQRPDSLSRRPARRRQNFPRQKRRRRAWHENSRASRSAECATKPRFAAIAALTSARCPDGLFKRSVALRAAIP